MKNVFANIIKSIATFFTTHTTVAVTTAVAVGVVAVAVPVGVHIASSRPDEPTNIIETTVVEETKGEPIDNESVSTNANEEQPDTTSAPEITSEPETTKVPETSKVIETTTAQETTKAPETTKVPETTKAPETTRTPETTKTPVTTKTPETTKVPETTAPPHTHSYTKKVVGPTCTADGYTLNTCNCGYSYKDNTTWKLGHLYTKWYTSKEATTTSTGLEECKCDRCGGATISKEIPKKVVNASIDSRIEAEDVYGQIKYKYGNCSVWDMRTWGNVFSISVLDNGGLRVTYDNKNGETIAFDVSVPPEGYGNHGIIQNDGSNLTQLIGAFS